MKTLSIAPAPRTRFRNVQDEALKVIGDVRCEQCPRTGRVGRAVYVMTIDGVPQRVCLACTKMRGITSVWLVGQCEA